MLILNADAVRKALPMKIAIDAMRRAFAAFSAGQVEVPMRTRLPVEPHRGVALFMPAFVHDSVGQSLAVKVISLYERNTRHGLPYIQAAVLSLDPATGRPIALLEGGTLTAIRTGATSGLATDLLARRDSRTAAIFGAGVQATTQLEAVCTVRPIETAWVYDPAGDVADKFIAEMAGQGPIPADLRRADSPREAIAEADIICTATAAHSPVFADADLKPGTHINAIGSYQPHVREIPAETVARALLVVDSRQAALAETGDLIQPIQAGLIGPEHIHAELGELVLGRKAGRTAPEQITLFKSVGVAVQDAVAAAEAIQQSQQAGLGQHVAW